jgi:hypothetical protein
MADSAHDFSSAVRSPSPWVLSDAPSLSLCLSPLPPGAPSVPGDHGQKFRTLHDLRVSSSSRGHANRLCIVPLFTDGSVSLCCSPAMPPRPWHFPSPSATKWRHGSDGSPLAVDHRHDGGNDMRDSSTRGDPIGIAGRRLSTSAKVSTGSAPTLVAFLVRLLPEPRQSSLSLSLARALSLSLSRACSSHSRPR